LQAILLHPDAWDILTQEEKQEVLAKFPDDTHILEAGTPNARPNLVSLRNDDNFRHDCARYCENIELGRHDEEWLSQAWAAHEKHKRGDFDTFLRDQFEEDWGTELPEKSNLTNSETESKKVVPESAESSSRGPEETAAPNRTPTRASQSPRPATSGDSAHSLQKVEASMHQVQNGEAEQRDPTGIVMDSSGAQSASRPPPSIDPTNSPEVSQKQEETTSAITVRSE
jgi:hypothetical protein